MRQETKWPDGDSSALTFTVDQPTSLTLRLRHPYWAQSGMRVRVNGVDAPVNTKPSSYAEITRVWKTGDRVSVSFPMSLRTEAMPDNPKRIAVFYGPTLLAANLGPVGDPEAGKPFYTPVLVTDGKPVAEWVRPVSLARQTYKTAGVGKPRDVELTPFHRLHDRRYTVYLDVYSQEDWAKRETEIRTEQEREARLAARTVDLLRIGEMQPERDHNVKGERTSAGEAFGRKWRHATDGGWFSFELKVDSSRRNELLCTYWGGETGQRRFDILIDGTRIASQQLLNNKPNEFIDVSYPIPAELTRGKEKVVVKFQAQPGNWAGGLFGARIVRAQE